MILPPRSIVSLVIVGDDLHAARVTLGPIGARVARTATIEGFLGVSAADARQSLRAVAGATRRVVLTAPGAWCAVRPVALTVREWPAAKPEILRSLDRLVPIPADEALAGLMNVYDESLAPADGRLVAISRGSIEPWRGPIENALGRPVCAMLAPMMATLGLGLQDRARAAVLEPVGMGDWLRHEFVRGVPVRAAEPVTDLQTESRDAVILPGGALTPTVTGVDLAVAAALASFVAPGAFAPILGRAPGRRIEWVAPAAALAAALALFIAAPAVTRARLGASVLHLKAEQTALVEPFARVRDLRRDTERLTRLIDSAVTPATAGWASVLPAIAEAQAALPKDGFLYRIEIDAKGVTISGEAPDAPTILGRLEASPSLTAARRTGPLAPSPEPGLDIFEMRADRAPEGASR